MFGVAGIVCPSVVPKNAYKSDIIYWIKNVFRNEMETQTNKWSYFVNYIEGVSLCGSQGDEMKKNRVVEGIARKPTDQRR